MGTAAGIYFSASVKKRAVFLREILLFCEELNIEVRYRASPLDEIVKKAKKSHEGSVFFSKLKEGGKFHESWAAAIKEENSLNSTDKEILLNMGNELGRSDITGQTAVIGLTSELLRKQLGDAEEQSARKASMYRSVGLLCGIAAAVMVM